MVKKGDFVTESMEWVLRLLKEGYNISNVDEPYEGILRLKLKIPPKHAILKHLHYLYIDEETGYLVSLVMGGFITFGKYEIYDGEKFIRDIERYNTLEEAEKRIIELVKEVREKR